MQIISYKYSPWKSHINTLTQNTSHRESSPPIYWLSLGIPLNKHFFEYLHDRFQSLPLIYILVVSYTSNFLLLQLTFSFDWFWTLEKEKQNSTGIESMNKQAREKRTCLFYKMRNYSLVYNIICILWGQLLLCIWWNCSRRIFTSFAVLNWKILHKDFT